MQTDSSEPRAALALYAKWSEDISDALSREKAYRMSAKKCVSLYEASSKENSPFAILYSNVEVLQPAVYNARPVPMVLRRHKDADPVAKAVSEVSTRLLRYLIDTEHSSYDTFDDLIQASVLDALLTNRGLSRYKFIPKTQHSPESVCGEAVRWDKFFHGYARSWKKVPWIGFEWDMTEEEIRANFPQALLDIRGSSTDDDPSEETLKGVTLHKVYEIWDKSTKTVLFFTDCHKEGPIKVVPDPLNLSGFFPVPRPLNFTRKVSTLVPTPLYEYYRSQAQELNELTRRLKAIIRAIKFRGAYNAAVEGIESILSAEENVLVPVSNVQSMPDGSSMDKLIWTVPINELVSASQSLYQQREAVKNVIYEITGISDILRGASVASETATAQNLKNQWGSLRLKKMQKEVQRYCRDSLAIILEIAGQKLSPETIRLMSNYTLLSESEKQQIALAMQSIPPGQPSPIPPDIQALQQLPSWEQVLELLSQDLLLLYRTDIETNSTLDAEASQDKQDINELLTALSQFLNGLGPLVQSGTLPFEIAQQMLLVICRRFNFGSQLEDSLLAMAAPKPDPESQPDPSAQIKLQLLQEESKVKAQQLQQEAQLSAQEFQQKQQLLAAESTFQLQQLEIKKAELELQRQSLAYKAQAQKAQLDLKLANLQTKAIPDATV